MYARQLHKYASLQNICFPNLRTHNHNKYGLNTAITMRS